MDKKFTSGIKEYILWVCVFTITLLPFLNIGSVLAQSRSAYYTGYYLYEEENSFAPWGIQGDINTISRDVPKDHFYAEWVCVILDYYPTQYWVQLGYSRKWYDGIWGSYLKTRFFRERYDHSGYYVSHFGSPTTYVDYNYKLENPEMSDYYTYQIKEGSEVKYSGQISVYHNDRFPVDQQAFVETTTDDIWITSSHFDNLKYLSGYYWFYWNTHEPRADSPYWLGQISHYEFYAYGGG